MDGDLTDYQEARDDGSMLSVSSAPFTPRVTEDDDAKKQSESSDDDEKLVRPDRSSGLI